MAVRSSSKPARRRLSPIQRFILDALESNGTTRYALATKINMSPTLIYRKLAQSKQHEPIERILAGVGASITIGGRVLHLDVDQKGRLIAHE